MDSEERIFSLLCIFTSSGLPLAHKLHMNAILQKVGCIQVHNELSLVATKST